MTAMPRGFSFVKGQRYAVIMAKTEYTLEPGVCGPGPASLEDAVKIVLDADDPAGDPAAALTKASEQAPTRPKADVLLMGSAYAPKGEPVAGVRTLLRVTRSDGEVVVDKEIDVVGERVWLADGTRSDIAPFTSMPMGWDRAFGGPGDAWNPAGRGKRGVEMPNLEVPDKPVATRDSGVAPICYGPINPAWRPRRDKLGSYGGDYIEKHWPWLPGDFDWSHFNAAPDDQQVEGFLRGDETIELRHLHPEHAEFTTKLPGKRCRAFVLIRERDGSETFREVEMVMDTLTILPDEGKVSVCWRGQTEARSLKLLEIEHLMMVTEDLGEPDKGLAHFRARLDRCIEKPHEVLLPKGVCEDIDAAMAEAERGKEEAQELQADAERQQTEAEKRRDAEIEKVRSKGLEVPLPKADAEAAPPSRFDTMNDVEHQVDQTLAMLDQHGDAPEIAAARAKLLEQKAQFPEIRARMHATHQRPTREELEMAAREGTPMRGRDLSYVKASGAKLAGLDLSGSLLEETDLSGADLSGVDLTGCSINKSNFTGATMHNAVMNGCLPVESAFDGADLSGAIVTKGMLATSTFPGARFAGAELSEVMLAQADLKAADLSRCRGERAIFFGTDFTGADLAHASLPNAVFMNATLEDATLFDADLRRATFAGAKGARACFVAADLQKASLNLAADFTNADFRMIQGAGTTFQGSTLEDTWFGGAELTRSIFAESTMRGTEMVCVNAPLTDFSDAIVEDADFTHSNLFQSTFDRAEMTRVHLEGASLFQSGFCETIFDTLWLADTNLNRTMLKNPEQ
jgi:uncharacterized protein YjbI with pentapeptide repeats